MYELLWFRMLGHVFGSTATATATLLAAYLFGLGLGAWIFGRLSDRLGRLLPVYILVEAGIGLYGIASHALLERGATLYALVYAWAAGSPGRLLAGRFAVSFLLVAIPTTLMGGTFPLMVQILRALRPGTGRAAGRAYAVNTAGAAGAALALPFLLLPRLGVASSLAAAAVCNFAAAALVLLRARRAHEGTGPAPAQADDAPLVTGSLAAASSGAGRETLPGAEAAPGASPRAAGMLLAAFFLSSFAALALETVWTRHLGIFFGPKIHIFAFVLFAYLIGLFLGGAAYARLVAAGRDPRRILRGALLAAAAGAAIPVPFLDAVSVPQLRLMLLAGVSYSSFLATTGLMILGLIIVPAVGLGLVFPAVVDLLARGGRRAGASVGLAYAVNTAGTTLGALAAGFVLIPSIGSQRTLEASVLAIAASFALVPPLHGTRKADSGGADSAGPATALRGRARASLRPGARDRSHAWSLVARLALPAVFLLLPFTPRWDWRFAHSSYVKDPKGFAKLYGEGGAWPLVESYNLLYLAEGAEATVSVIGFKDGSRSLYVNGKADASNMLDDMVVQRLLGVVPVLFHPAPKSALVIGVGSGTTVAMLRDFGLETIDAAEISPEVGEAARLHFREIGEGALDDPRVRLVLDDGRSFLHFRPPSSYDIIVSEPSNPWMAGVSALFTDEFFAEMKEKLRPGGIACQWFHFYSMSPDHIRLIARTFRRHFPDAAILLTRGRRINGDMLLVGAKGPLRLARLPEDPAVPERIRRALGEVLNAGTAQLLGGLAAGPGELAAFAGPGPLNTDDRPLLELDAPADLFDQEFPRTRAELVRPGAAVFLAAGPTADESAPEAEIVRDGFAEPRGLPAGAETRRGATVLTRASGAGEPQRWVLLGREFEEGTPAAGSTSLQWLVRPIGIPDELAELAGALAGPGSPSMTEVTVNGHGGLAMLLDSPSGRTVVVGWACPVQKRAFFLRRRVPLAGALPPAALAADLILRFPCAHPPPPPSRAPLRSSLAPPASPVPGPLLSRAALPALHPAD